MMGIAVLVLLALVRQEPPATDWRMIGMGDIGVFGADVGSVRREGDRASVTGVVVRSTPRDGDLYYITHDRFDCTARTVEMGPVDVYSAEDVLLRTMHLSVRNDLGGTNSALEREFEAACENTWPSDQAHEPTAAAFAVWTRREIMDTGVFARLTQRSPQADSPPNPPQGD